MSEPFINPHMTRPQGASLAEQQLQTFPGMAHWAGSGPAGRSCRECSFWCLPADSDQSYRREEGVLLARRCRKFTRLMRAGDPDMEAGPAVPPAAAACRHFEQAEVVPFTRSGQPIEGLEFWHKRSGASYLASVKHVKSGRLVIDVQLVKKIGAFKGRVVTALGAFDWTSEPDSWNDNDARRAALRPFVEAA